MAIRVLRLMEYTYPDLEAAHDDMGHWVVQGTRTFGRNKAIRSTVILNPTPFEEPLPVEEEK